MKFYCALPMVFATAVVVLTTSAAEANCARPTDYSATVQGNAVTVCPEDFGRRPCPDPDGMLRVGAGAAVKLADVCSTRNGSRCYVDECVPPGTYQYGYAKPFECCAACCGTFFFAEVTVQSPLPSDCTPDAGSAAPTSYSGSPPWVGASALICAYQSTLPANPNAGSLSAPDGGSLSSAADDSGAVRSSGPERDYDARRGDNGCAVRRLDAPARAVLGFNGLVAGLGLLLTARRRRARS